MMIDPATTTYQEITSDKPSFSKREHHSFDLPQ